MIHVNGEEHPKGASQKEKCASVSTNTSPSPPSYLVQKSQYSRTHLLSLTWAQRWDDVHNRIRSHPEEARHINQSLRTPLHLCMFGFHSLPTSIVVELLGANQYAVIHGDSVGWTPVHYACQFGVTPEIVTLLLCSAIPLAVRSSTLMSRRYQPPISHISIPPSPLFLCCNRNCDLQFLSVLLDYSLTYPNEIGCWVAPITGAERYDDVMTGEYSLLKMKLNHEGDTKSESWNSHKNSLEADFSARQQEEAQYHQIHSNLTPLEVLWTHFPSNRMWRQEDGTKDTANSSTIINTVTENEPRNDKREDFTHFWDKIICILSFHESRIQAEKKHEGCESPPKYQVDKNSSFINDRKELLHHVCALICPMPTLVQFILRLYPHQTLERDSGGNLPLHHTILALRLQNIVLERCPGKNSKGIQVFRDVLASNTTAASVPNKDERYPLFLALENPILSWEDGLDALVSADPSKLRTTDVSTHMYPFMLAAAEDREDILGINVVFLLLKRCPEVVSLNYIML